MSNQRNRIRELFEKNPNTDISLSRILDMRIAKYSCRITELRQEGMNIVNHWKYVQVNGDKVKYSWYRYVPKIKESLF